MVDTPTPQSRDSNAVKNATTPGASSTSGDNLVGTGVTSTTGPAVVNPMPASSQSAPIANVDPNKLARVFGLTIKPNIMGDYDQATYFITWSMLPDIQGTTDEIIIAQTGTTVLNIQELTMDMTMGSDFRCRNYNSTKITLKLFEPLAANLTQKILAAAEELVVDNYQQSPWKLSVSLQGFDSKSGLPVKNIGGSAWTWNVRVYDIVSVVNETGSIHTVTMGSYDEIGFTNGNLAVPGAASLKGDTVEAIMQAAIVMMNKQNVEMFKYQHITYSIDYRSYNDAKIPGDLQLVANPKLHQTKGMAYKSSTRNSEGSQIGTGQDLPSLLDIVLSNSETACKMAGVPFEGSNGTGNPVLQSVMHRIEAKTTLGEYNPKFNDYAKKIDYMVVPYTSPRIVARIADAKSIQDPQVMKNKIQKIVDQIGIHKEYDYTFTGMNTEVFKFDSDLNCKWFVNLSLMMGNIHIGTASPGQSWNPRDQIMQDQAKIGDMRPDMSAEHAIIAATTNENTKARAQSKLAQMEANLKIYSTDINQTKAAALRARQQKTTYIDDLDTARLLKSGFAYYPIMMSQTPDTYNKGGNLNELGPDHNTFAYSAILNQLYGDETGDHMQEITLEIRGDPFWFGITNTGDKNTNAGPISNENVTGAQWALGENTFIFRFNVPMGYDEKTGNVLLTSANLYTGFYVCYNIEHRFRDGAFVQVLKAKRIPGCELSQVAMDLTSSEAAQVAMPSNPIPAPTGNPASTPKT